ncbi:MAG: polyamine aminopropyltransferase [Xanthomonadales bacterium]|nr:polyamine aminopropyltransferase [Xanthomonadales bacterium]
MVDTHWIHEHHRESGSAIGYEVVERLHVEESPYQRIEVFATRHFGHAMALDGCWMLTERENFIYHEMMTHPALFTHDQPRDVVVIGGGDCGTLREVLKHPSVQRAVQIELDERVTRVAEKFFPELTSSNKDSRAEFRFEDGIAWMQAAGPGSADVIIVDSTDPVGPAAGLYDVKFFRTCFETLREGGILVQQSESPLLHVDLLKAMRRRLPKAGFDAVRQLLFPQPCYPSGWWSATMARRGGNFDSFRHKAAGAIDTRYYNEQIHQAAGVLPAYLAEALRQD